jgi:hypothetical protein
MLVKVQRHQLEAPEEAHRHLETLVLTASTEDDEPEQDPSLLEHQCDAAVSSTKPKL